MRPRRPRLLDLFCGAGGAGVGYHRAGFDVTGVDIVRQPHYPKHPLVFTHDKRKRHYGQLDQSTAFVQVTGGGNATLANKLDAMGIDWMCTHHEVNESIPAYTEFIGRQLIEHVAARASEVAA